MIEKHIINWLNPVYSQGLIDNIFFKKKNNEKFAKKKKIINIVTILIEKIF